VQVSNVMMRAKMDVYVFYYNDSTAKVFAKNDLTADDIQQLKQGGFKKYPTEFTAENKQAAIAKLNANNEENLKNLQEYSSDILFSNVIEASTYLLRSLIK
jgi:hypothetical protein